MVTQTITKPLFGATGQSEGKNHPYFTSIVLDFSTITHTSSDVFEVISIPANTMVLAAGVDVLTLDAGSGTLALGDGSVVYVAASTAAAAGQETHSDAIGEVFVSYDTANTLDLTVATAVLTTGVVRVWAIMCDYTDPIEAQRVTFA